MSSILLTPNDSAILGPIAKLLGWILDWIYTALAYIGIENVGLSIIILTIIIYTLMLPLTYKQQKFSKMSQKMQPEMKKIQDKYKGKKDQESMQAMNQETQLLYQKYGISPMGSCVQMLIQMPIWFALYRVFYNVPAYISIVKEKFVDIANEIVSVDGFAEIMTKIQSDFRVNLTTKPNFVVSDSNTIDAVKNFVIDVIYKVPTVDSLESYFGELSSVSKIMESGLDEFHKFNLFFGMNISNTPWNIIKESFTNKHYLLIIPALAIPVIYYFVQKLTLKLSATTQEGKKNNAGDNMSQQMNMMNKVMPLMMVFFCFITPVGLGIYWVASSAYRALQQYLINKHFDKLDLDAILKQNEEKAKKKRAKKGISEEQMKKITERRTKSIKTKAAYDNSNNEEVLEKANEMKSTAKAGSLAAKANLVRDYNEKNSRK